MTAARPAPGRLVTVVLAVALAVASLIALPGPAAHAATGPVLQAGQGLRSGEAVTAGSYRLVMQGDGNLVVYASGGRVRWHSRTAGNPGARAVVQADGNLVLYARSGRPLWHTGTWGNPGARAVLQGDGNLVVYGPAGRPLWHIGADVAVRTVDATGLYAIRAGVAHAPCGDPAALARSLASSRTLAHGGTGWNGQIVAVGQDAPALVGAWRASPPHLTIANGTWSRMWAGAARGTDGRMYGVVNFCR